MEKNNFTRIIKQTDGTFSVQLTEEYGVAGFSSEKAAGEWILSYMSTLFQKKLEADANKALAGAVLLDDTKGGRKQ